LIKVFEHKVLVFIPIPHIYQRVFEHVGYRGFSRDCQSGLVAHTAKTAAASIDARYLFDNCIHYLAHNKIATPKYYLLQQLVSSAINNERKRLDDILANSMSASLASTLDELLDSEGAAALASIRRSVNNRAELSHEPTRVREWGMRKFKSMQQAQRFLGARAALHNLFNLGRHLVSAENYRFFRQRAFLSWEKAVTVAKSKAIPE